MGKQSTAVQRAEEQIAPTIAMRESLGERCDSLFNAISRRAYELFQNRGSLGCDVDDWMKAESELLHPVHINIVENEQTLEVTAEVPGFGEKELEISVEPERLTITGKHETSKEEKKGKTFYSEHCASEIFRAVDLPVKVETKDVVATLKNGMLNLTLPKAMKSQNISVQIKAA